jgi:hypothetical protein
MSEALVFVESLQSFLGVFATKMFVKMRIFCRAYLSSCNRSRFTERISSLYLGLFLKFVDTF